MSAMESEVAMEKIRRLLRLGRSPNQHEAASAMAMAAKIALKNQIDLATVKADEERERMSHEWFDSKADFNLVEDAALCVVLCVFPVNAVTTRRQAAFIGMPSAIAQAKWATAFLIECAGRELKAWRALRRAERRGARPTKSSERNFLEGWKYGLIHQARAEKRQVAELMDSSTAIVLADQEKERDAYTEGMTKRKSRPSRGTKPDRGAFIAGMRAGLDTKLSVPVENRQENLSLCL